MAVMFDIPYEPSCAGDWLVTVQASEELGGNAQRRFPSRKAALAYANHESRRRDPGGKNTAINLEGADGRWRGFTQDIMPL
jgi:hypothetical protein